MARLLIGAAGAAIAIGALSQATSGSTDPSRPSGAPASAPPTTVRPCRTRAEPGWRPQRSDLVMGSTRSALDSFATTPSSTFASRADSVGFKRYIDGPRGRALPQRKREQLLRLAPHYYGQLKTPIAVKAGHTITLTVAPEDREHASFIFDFGRHGRQIGPHWSVRVSDGVPRIRLTGCARNEPMFSGPGTVGPWTAFPGAMVVAGARCITLELRERNRPTFRYYMGFGKPDCRGPADSPPY